MLLQHRLLRGILTILITLVNIPMKHLDYYPNDPELATEQDLLDAWDSLDAVPPGLYQLDDATIIEIQALHETTGDDEPENDVRGIKVSTLSGDVVLDENLSVHKTIFDTATVLHVPIHEGETTWQSLLDRLYKNPASLVREEELAQIAMNLRIFGLPFTDDRMGKITNVASVIAGAIEAEDPKSDDEGQLRVIDRAKIIERSLQGETEALMRRVAERMRLKPTFWRIEEIEVTATLPITDLNRLVSLAKRAA